MNIYSRKVNYQEANEFYHYPKTTKTLELKLPKKSINHSMLIFSL